MDGTRFVVGELWRERDGYAFTYRSALPTAEGFGLLPEFPEHRTSPNAYRASYLFATFAQRVPSPTRADLRDLLASWGVEHGDDPLEILARSGGVQTTDRLELAEYRPEDDPLDRPLEMRVAGATRLEEVGTLSAGDALELRRELKNEHDPNATLFLFEGDQRVGYVPRQYAVLVAGLLDTGTPLRAVAVRRLVLPPEGGRWVVRVSRDLST
jgi:hypothetical protein